MSRIIFPATSDRGCCLNSNQFGYADATGEVCMLCVQAQERCTVSDET